MFLDLVDFQAVAFLDPLVPLGQQDSLESLAALGPRVTLGKEDHRAPLAPQDPAEQLAFMMAIHCVPIPVHLVAQDIQAYQACGVIRGLKEKLENLEDKVTRVKKVTREKQEKPELKDLQELKD